VPALPDPCASLKCSTTQECIRGTCITTGKNIPILQQEAKTLQIVNGTSEAFLHVFLNLLWVENGWKLAHASSTQVRLYDAISWGPRPFVAWDPLGADPFAELIIPRGEYAILNIPEVNASAKEKAHRIFPLRFTSAQDAAPILSTADAQARVRTQWPIMIEGGLDVVADGSAVDGVNFKMFYQLTTGTDTVQTMTMLQNPCAQLAPAYHKDAGCVSPQRVDCYLPNEHGEMAGLPSCYCNDASQRCTFNECSDKLFQIPDDLKQYMGQYDGGDPAKCTEIVKPFINNSSNLRAGGPQSRYCTSLHQDTGDFTTYCYDYDDTRSSPYLRSPYKLKVTYLDLA
jgi:hypothetical protein